MFHLEDGLAANVVPFAPTVRAVAPLRCLTWQLTVLLRILTSIKSLDIDVDTQSFSKQIHLCKKWLNFTHWNSSQIRVPIAQPISCTKIDSRAMDSVVLWIDTDRSQNVNSPGYSASAENLERYITLSPEFDQQIFEVFEESIVGTSYPWGQLYPQCNNHYWLVWDYACLLGSGHAPPRVWPQQVMPACLLNKTMAAGSNPATSISPTSISS